MTSAAAEFAKAAASFLGTRFRLHGRDPRSGLDCVGLLLSALQAAGRKAPGLAGYSLRSRDFAPFLRHFAGAGFAETHDAIEPGDVMQVIPGPGQLHFLIASMEGDFIHAHAGLGRVVRTPHPLTWQVERVWRLQHD